jgi:hypothetical protein
MPLMSATAAVRPTVARLPYERDVHGRAPQPARRLEIAEAAADDDDAVGAHDTAATGWAVAISLWSALSASVDLRERREGLDGVAQDVERDAGADGHGGL